MAQFSILFSRQLIEVSAIIIGYRIISEFIIQFEPQAPFKLKLNTTDWNYASFLGLVGGANFYNQYEASLSCDIDLSSEQGGFWQSSGEVKVSKFLLKRDSLSLSNAKEMQVIMNQGQIKIKDFNLSGFNSTLAIVGDNFNGKNLNLNINGKTDLRLLHIFAPFLEDLSGPTTISVKVAGPYYKPEILGSAYAENAFVRLKGLPHAFEKVKVDALFSHSKILVNSVRGQFAGGNFDADGNLEINGLQDIAVNIKAKATDINLHVPEKINTQGDAQIHITGNWFPYKISGNYIVDKALIDREFTENDNTGAVKQSSFLPKILLQGGFEPIVFDMDIDLQKNIEVKNSQFDGYIVGQINLKGTPKAPILSGQITSKPGSKILFRDKVFDVQNVIVKFDDPTENNPEIYVAANSRFNNYDINLLLQGRAKDPQLRLTSQPPLAEQDIISLLAFGIISSRLDQDVKSDQQAAQTGYQIGSAILSQNPLNKEIQKRLGVELQFTPTFDESKNVSVLKGTVSRKITPKITASASRSFGNTTYDTKLTYNINEKYSAVGFWEGREEEDATTTSEPQQSSTGIFGLDLEYRLEFK